MNRLKVALAAVAILLTTAQAEAASDKPKPEPHPLPLLKFSRDCVAKAFELNYGAYQRQLQDFHVACMTDRAFIDWRSSLERVGIMDQLKTAKGGLVLSANVGAGQVLHEEVRAIGNNRDWRRYTATVRTPVAIVFNGNADRAQRGFVETDVIRVRQNDRIVGYAIHAIRLSIKN
ncbi:DotI/IcmL family type IV secretion protein [Pseudomonas lopnurensis]|uniref:DotI/IcmL family type IV secretion protein n=1 Tax=Pseudomonas lopnurensis TaxID=1477517 RepID=UPI00187A5ACB|nr:DotI/IcmL family type IV secretion protein [Pseudomonas lopnurensis]MBE7373197.1 DotI/IcmL family type IV secretion protein [Pseudomonas lopnurensis]